jgi:uncharacterized protein
MAPQRRRIAIRLIPRARRNEIAGERAGRLLVRVTAPPVDEKANAALRRLLAARAEVPRSKVRIVAGARSRDKVVEIEGTVPRDLDCPPPEDRPDKRSQRE